MYISLSDAGINESAFGCLLSCEAEFKDLVSNLGERIILRHKLTERANLMKAVVLFEEPCLAVTVSGNCITHPSIFTRAMF
jgi:hypothetical protein